jgi:TolA-binding protein
MNTKKLILLLACLLGASALQCSTYFNMFYNAEEAFKEGRRIHEKAMLVYPDSILVMPGDDAKAKYDRAIEKSAKVLEVYPKDKKWHEYAYFLLGESYYYEKETAKAIRWFRLLQQEYPASKMIPESYLFIGKAYLVNEDLDKAEETLKYVLTTYPELDKDQKVSLLLVEVETRREGESRSIKRLEQVCATVRSADKRSELMVRVAEMYMDLRQNDSAVAVLSRTPRMRSDPEQGYRIDRDLVTCYVQDDSIAHALALLDDMRGRRKYEAHKREMTYDKGLILEQRGRIEEAIAAFKEVIGPTDSAALQGDTSQMVGKALYALGQLYQKRKCNYREAQQCYHDINDRKGRDTAVAGAATQRMKAIQRIAELRKLLSQPETWNLPDFGDTSKHGAAHDSAKAPAGRDTSRLAGAHDSAKTSAIRDSGKLMASRDSARAAFKRGNHTADTVRKAPRPDSVKYVINRADTLYKIGELFYYDIDEPDSAMHQFLLCAADSSADSIHRPKALCAAAYIAKHVLRDTVRADSLFTLVLQRYPENDNVRRIAHELKNIPDSMVMTRKGRAAAAFRVAETKYIDESDIKGAVQAFFNIYKEYPDLEIAPKSLFAAAWLTDNELHKKKAAKALYERICERFPNSIYCTAEAKPRVQVALDTMKAYGELADASATPAKSAGAPPPPVAPAGDTLQPTAREPGHRHGFPPINPKNGLPIDLPSSASSAAPTAPAATPATSAAPTAPAATPATSAAPTAPAAPPAPSAAPTAPAPASAAAAASVPITPAVVPAASAAASGR